MNSISTDSYKGVRDFYPEDLFVQKYIFTKMRQVAEAYGYAEYDASVLEPTELYKAKSGDEIVNDQTYSFKDRGDRDVTLRPEMTPTVARMVAARKRELAFPLRWYSIPNLFRYEKPQRGRLREHWQLNVDLFGSDSINAEIEIITIAARIMEAFGAKHNDYEIKINHRKLLNFVMKTVYKLTEDEAVLLIKLIDKKNKLEPAEFLAEAKKMLGEKTEDFIELMAKRDPEAFKLHLSNTFGSEILGLEDIITLLGSLKKIGIAATFDPTLARGFDYYTGIVFEVFDTNEENRKALFGGGRYDDLLSIFGSEKLPAIGFGMGDVRLKDYLEVRGLLPKYESTAKIYICSVTEQNIDASMEIAEKLREYHIAAAVDFSGKKLGDQIKTAVKQSTPFALIVGDDEVREQKFTLRNLSTGNEEKVGIEHIPAKINLK